MNRVCSCGVLDQDDFDNWGSLLGTSMIHSFDGTTSCHEATWEESVSEAPEVLIEVARAAGRVRDHASFHEGQGHHGFDPDGFVIGTAEFSGMCDALREAGL